MAKRKNDERYFKSDGSIGRFLEVVEILPDGTRIFENGRKARPSTANLGGERGSVRLDSMTSEERKEWEKHLLERVGRDMSAYYSSLETGADKYL